MLQNKHVEEIGGGKKHLHTSGSLERTFFLYSLQARVNLSQGEKFI